MTTLRFGVAPSAVTAITFKVMFSIILTAFHNSGKIRNDLTPVVAKVAKLYDGELATLFTKNTKT